MLVCRSLFFFGGISVARWLLLSAFFMFSPLTPGCNHSPESTQSMWTCLLPGWVPGHLELSRAINLNFFGAWPYMLNESIVFCLVHFGKELLWWDLWAYLWTRCYPRLAMFDTQASFSCCFGGFTLLECFCYLAPTKYCLVPRTYFFFVTLVLE